MALRYFMQLCLHFGFCVFSEICVPDDGTYNSSRFIQDMITIVNEMCSSISVMIFVIFGRLLIIYNFSIAKRLKYCLEMNARQQFKEIVSSLHVLKQLQEASTLLHRRFGFILLAICGLTIISVVNSVYFVVRSSSGGDYISPCWDISFLAENVVRLFLVCRTSDCIRLSVSLSIQSFSLELETRVILYRQ